jgi:uncharacterized membrane protein
MTDFITAKLSDLAKIPEILLQKQIEIAKSENDKKKLQQAINLGIMRRLSNNPGCMFGMRNY